MNADDMVALTEAWMTAKEAERLAIEARRRVEDEILNLVGLTEHHEGTETYQTKVGHTVKIVGRLSRKVDADKAQEIAAEHGLTEHLSSLFRWKPEINMTNWKRTSPEVTAILSDAVTVTPSRPSFSVTLED